MARLISWNVNGLRAIEKKGFIDFVAREQADFFCLQEVKAIEGQLPPTLREVPGYHFYINSAERKGYSGTAVYTRHEPLSVSYGLGVAEYDTEGRTLVLEYEKFVLYNIYYPNGSARPERLQYKLDFYEVFHNHALEQVAAGKSVIVCGDFNTAHKEIDLARPKENETSSGFLPVERAFLDRFVASGFVDTFRQFESRGEFYSWWDMKTRARERNIGWRIDYFYVSQDLAPKLTGASLMMDQQGSDHCPVVLEIDV